MRHFGWFFKHCEIKQDMIIETYRKIMFSMGAGKLGTFQGMFAFQHRKASDKCCKMVLALFCLMPSGIMSRMSCMTEALNSMSKWDSTRCLVTVLATPLEWRPSNCLDNKLPNQRSSKGVTPRRKKSQTRHPGAQNPHPGPLPTGPWNWIWRPFKPRLKRGSDLKKWFWNQYACFSILDLLPASGRRSRMPHNMNVQFQYPCAIFIIFKIKLHRAWKSLEMSHFTSEAS